MVNQKVISLKLDNDVYAMLCTETVIGNLKRNRLINEAIKVYIGILRARRKRDARFKTEAEMMDYLLEVAATVGRRSI